jgi:hypothetical protein
MKKILLLPLFFLVLWGCEKDFDSTVDTQTYSYQVVSLSSFSSAIGNSTITVFLTLNSSSGVSKVFFDIYASDGSKLNAQEVQLLDNGNTANGDQTSGDNRYTNLFALNSSNPIGIYTIKFYVTDKGNTTKQVAVHNFNYDNGQNNEAPVISNLIMPDEIEAGETILFTVDVSDNNGLNDVEVVFYEAYNPSGVRVVNSQGIFQFPMFDDGKTRENGDAAAGDGEYTVVLTFPSNIQKGTWRFEFQAKDRSGALSNKIIHNFVVI